MGCRCVHVRSTAAVPQISARPSSHRGLARTGQGDSGRGSVRFACEGEPTSLEPRAAPPRLRMTAGLAGVLAAAAHEVLDGQLSQRRGLLPRQQVDRRHGTSAAEKGPHESSPPWRQWEITVVG